MNILEHLVPKTYFPLELFSLDISITGAVVTLWLSAIFVFAFYFIVSRRLSLVPGRAQNVAEVMILFIRDEVASMIPKTSEAWLPFLVAVFSFILINNLLGLVPGVSSATANINVTATLAVIVFITFQLTSLFHHGPVGFLKQYLPQGIPLAVSLLMVPIEIVSQLARPFSLAVRLFANMFAGHVMMLILISLIFVFKSYVIAPLPFIGNVVVLSFEVFIAFIQAFIFTFLTAVYISTAIESH